MADNYRLFSEVLPGLDVEQQAWVAKVLGVEDGDVATLTAAGIDTTQIEAEDWPGFSWRLLDDPAGDLLLFAEESGNVVHVAEFVRAFLARFRPAGWWQMTWADTCSKPRIGQFSGGGAFVTAAGVQFLTPEEWLDQQRKEFLATSPITPPSHSQT